MITPRQRLRSTHALEPTAFGGGSAFIC